MGKVRLGDYIERVSIRATDLDDYSKLEALGVSNVNGITKTSHVKSADLGKYLYIEENYFAYNPYRINVGSIGLTQKDVKGLVSPAYIVFKTKDTLKPELLFDFLKSFDGLQQINKLAKGTVRKTLSFENLSKIELIVPSLEKQESILLLKLNTEHIKNSLSIEIQTQQELLKKLRQSILQEAIEGKLTASWRELNPDVESASVLLEKIKQEKEQLAKEKKIKKQKPLPPISEDEIPFYIPDSWEWCKIGNISNVKVGSTPSRPVKEYWNGDIHWVSSGEVANNFIYDTKEMITKKGFESTSLIIYPKGSVLVAMIGQGKTRGQTSILKIDATINQNVAGMVFEYNNMISEYVWIFFLSRYELTRSGASGGNQPALNGMKIKNTFLPLPPLQEQEEIVKRIETLFKICDELETQINSSKINSQTLMQAVLKEAFKE